MGTGLVAEQVLGTGPIGRSEELQTLVSGWRARLVRADFPALYPSGRVTSKKKRVSQADLAHLVGYSVQWVSNLERGLLANYSSDFLDNMAYVLGLSSDEKLALFLLATGREPSTGHHISPPSVTTAVRKVIDSHAAPACVVSRAWDLLYPNKVLLQWFPELDTELNLMRLFMLYFDAAQRLVDWETAWVPVLLAELRAAHARWPDDERIRQVLTEVLEQNAVARRAWTDDPMVKTHSDGDRRWVCPMGTVQPVEVEIVVSALLRSPGERIVVLVPLFVDLPTAR